MISKLRCNNGCKILKFVNILQKRTVDRLLKKPQMKLSRGTVMKSKQARASGRMITYVKRRDTNSISFPVGLDISVFHGLHATKAVQNPPRYYLFNSIQMQS